MARTMGKLTAMGIAKANKPNMYGDGEGLWLQVFRAGNKSWVLRYRVHGLDRYMGLGSCHLVTLADA